LNRLSLESTIPLPLALDAAPVFRPSRGAGDPVRYILARHNRWWPTSVEAIKKAKRYGAVETVEEAGFREVEWVYAVASRWPGIDWWSLIAPNSQAADFILWANSLGGIVACTHRRFYWKDARGSFFRKSRPCHPNRKE
jgi:hypothetical protein